MFATPKAAIFAVALACAPLARAEFPYSFDIDNTNYQLLKRTLSTKKTAGSVVISALWEVVSPDYNARWYVEVQGCDAAIGHISIHGGIKTTAYSWAWDGYRAVDLIAASLCGLKDEKTKK